MRENTLVKVWATGILSRGKKYQKREIEFEPPRPYLKALTVDDLLFHSGRGGNGESIKAQIRSSLDIIGKTLAELGSSWNKVLLLSCYVKRLGWLDTVENLVREHTHLGAHSIDLVPADEYARPEMFLEVEATAYVRRGAKAV